MASLKRDVVSGLVVLAPFAVTIIGAILLVQFLAGLPVVQQIDPWWIRAPIVLSVFVVLVMATGYLMRTALGMLIQDRISELINHIPLIRVAYNASELAIRTVLRGGDDRVRPVKVRTWQGTRVTAFWTGNRTVDGRYLCFFPTAPNITTGYVIEVEEADVIETGETVEQALTRILSAGLAQDDDPAGDSPLQGATRVETVSGVQIPQSD